MFVDKTAELGLLSLLAELTVLKSVLDEEILCKSLVFEEIVDKGGFFKFFFLKQKSQLSAVGEICYFPQSGQGRHHPHLESPVRISL